MTKGKVHYKVSNHHAVFRLGEKYYDEYLQGARSFAISSTGYQRSQQATLLGIATFFDHKSEHKICIISDNLFNGFFKSVISACSSAKITLDDTDMRVQRFYDHFDFIDLADIFYKKKVGINIDLILHELREHYDVIFWDVPELEKIKHNIKTYQSLLEDFDSFGIVANHVSSSKKRKREIISLFVEHGINLEGLRFLGFDEKSTSNKLREVA